jgi:hypothetical protein
MLSGKICKLKECNLVSFQPTTKHIDIQGKAGSGTPCLMVTSERLFTSGNQAMEIHHLWIFPVSDSFPFQFPFSSGISQLSMFDYRVTPMIVKTHVVCKFYQEIHPVSTVVEARHESNAWVSPNPLRRVTAPAPPSDFIRRYFGVLTMGIPV